MSSLNWDAPQGCHRGFLFSGYRQTLTQTMQQSSLPGQAETIRLPLFYGLNFAQNSGGISE